MWSAACSALGSTTRAIRGDDDSEEEESFVEASVGAGATGGAASSADSVRILIPQRARTDGPPASQHAPLVQRAHSAGLPTRLTPPAALPVRLRQISERVGSELREMSYHDHHRAPMDHFACDARTGTCEAMDASEKWARARAANLHDRDDDAAVSGVWVPKGGRLPTWLADAPPPPSAAGADGGGGSWVPGTYAAFHGESECWHCVLPFKGA